MGENQEQALAQMRKSVQMLGSSTEKYGDPTLMRFLIARSMDTDKASKMFVQWQKWRDAFVPLGHIPESEVEDELNANKIYLQGLSEKGYPVMVVKSNKHFPSKDQLQFKNQFGYALRSSPLKIAKCIRFKHNLDSTYQSNLDSTYQRTASIGFLTYVKAFFSLLFVDAGLEFVVYLLDKTIASSFKGREIGNEKLIGIIDLKQISYKNTDAHGLITGFQYLQAYYPERLAKLYLLHMPWFFVSIWRLVSRFLEKATLEKVVIVKNEEERRDLVKDIGEEALAEEYGGRSKLVPIQDFVLMPLEDSAI